jgi:hypothetical protein
MPCWKECSDLGFEISDWGFGIADLGSRIADLEMMGQRGESREHGEEWGRWKRECGPVVVPNEWDYAAASMGKWKGGSGNDSIED